MSIFDSLENWGERRLRMARAIAIDNARHMSRDDLVEFYIDECTQSIDEYDKQKDIERRYNLLTQTK